MVAPGRCLREKENAGLGQGDVVMLSLPTADDNLGARKNKGHMSPSYPWQF